MHESRRAPAVVLADDGELDDVRSVLDDLGVEYAHWGKQARLDRDPQPTQLLIASVDRARALGLRRETSRDSDRAVWIATVDAEAPVRRESLLRQGFDFLVRRPVHTAALRLVISRALFQGGDRRVGTRVAVGYLASLRVGLFSRDVTLVDLSPRGARVLSREPVKKGKRATLVIPSDLVDGRALSIKATVVRAGRGDIVGGERGEVALGLRFEKFDRSTKDRLRDLLVELSTGPVPLPEELSGLADPGARTQRKPRGVYEERVLAFGDDDLALVGSDLSSGGMRVREADTLRVGQSLRLAIEAGPRQEPIVVRARVVRDDGSQGKALRFEEVEAGGQERLDQLVSALPNVEVLDREPTAGPGAIGRLIPSLTRLRSPRRRS